MSVRPAAALVTTIVLWASAFAAIRAALEHFSAGHLSVLRLLVAAVALGAVAAARGVRLPAARDLPAIAAVGFAGMTAYQLLLNAGRADRARPAPPHCSSTSPPSSPRSRRASSSPSG